MKELSLEEAALAWAQGKRVEACRKHCVDWKSLIPVAGGEGYYSPHAFVETNKTHPFRFRLAPETPAKKLRPWTPEEVPVGVKIRERECDGWFTPTCAGAGEIEAIVDGAIETVKLTELADDYEHSLDNGKTWLPCGVEVDA